MTRMFEWQDRYSVDHQMLDSEHKELFAHADTLHVAMLEGRGVDVLRPLFAAVVDYANRHFSHEEEWMRQCGYPGQPDHVREHDGFRTKFAALDRRLRSGEDTITIEAMQFLAGWLKRHVTGSDLRAADYSRSLMDRGEAVPEAAGGRIAQL